MALLATPGNQFYTHLLPRPHRAKQSLSGVTGIKMITAGKFSINSQFNIK